MAVRRVRKELLCMKELDSNIITAEPINQNFPLHWWARIKGPENSPYAGGTFLLDIVFPEEYPFHPMKCRFLTKIYHPCISSDGGIDLDLLRDHWSPALTIAKVLLGIYNLITDFSPDDPMVPEIARQYKRDRAQFDAIAREWTQRFASD